MTEYMISPEDQAIRKKWLFFLILNVLFIISTSLIEVDFSKEKIISAALAIIFFSSSFYIMYHCAYKKMGTKWLTFSLVLNVICLPMGLGILFMEEIDLITKIIQLMTIPLTFGYIFYSNKLRRVNKKISKEKLLLIPEYVENLQILKSATSKEDLKLRFAKIVREDPAISFLIKKDYKRLKKSFA